MIQPVKARLFVLVRSVIVLKEAIVDLKAYMVQSHGSQLKIAAGIVVIDRPHTDVGGIAVVGITKGYALEHGRIPIRIQNLLAGDAIKPRTGG